VGLRKINKKDRTKLTVSVKFIYSLLVDNTVDIYKNTEKKKNKIARKNDNEIIMQQTHTHT